jgi:peptidoglycan hydrolase-like protein with peptidoglycan-binding domain
MKFIGPALLVLCSFSVAALGVPASFAQAKSAPHAAPGKKSVARTFTAKNHSPAPASGRKSANKSAGTATKKSSGKSSKRTRKQPGQKAPTGDRINEIQLALAKQGSFQGSPTGKWDEETSAAMRKFQASHGLNPNGKLDAPSLQRLGLGSEIAGIAAPSPPPGSVSRLSGSALAAESARNQ